MIEKVEAVATEVVVRPVFSDDENKREDKTESDVAIVAGSESTSGMSRVVSKGDGLLWLFVSSARWVTHAFLERNEKIPFS